VVSVLNTAAALLYTTATVLVTLILALHAVVLQVFAVLLILNNGTVNYHLSHLKPIVEN
jgi:hypothetical protein